MDTDNTEQLSNLAREALRSPDRREREEALASAILHTVAVLQKDVPYVGAGSMTLLADLVSPEAEVENPFSIVRHEGDAPSLELPLARLPIDGGEDYNLSICYATDGSKWFVSGWNGEDSLFWECRELTDLEIHHAIKQLAEALSILSQVFPNTAPSIAAETQAMKGLLTERPGTRHVEEGRPE